MNRIIFLALMALTVCLGLTVASCDSKPSVPSEFVGDWECQLNRHQKAVLNIGKDGKYKLTIYQTNERYDAKYSGDIVIVDENTIKLPSSQYIREFNNNRRESDPALTIVTVNTTNFLRKDGAFSQSESGLDKPIGYLKKVN